MFNLFLGQLKDFMSFINTKKRLYDLLKIQALPTHWNGVHPAVAALSEDDRSNPRTGRGQSPLQQTSSPVDTISRFWLQTLLERV